MSDETTGLIAGLLAVVAALIVYSMIRAAARGQLTKESGFGIVSSPVKKTDATWAAGHEAALPVARKTIVATAAVWVIVLVIGLIVGKDWAGYLGIVPYAVIIVGFMPMVQAANAAAREAAKKSPKKKRKKK